MIRQGHNNVSIFVGTEVEHTPAHGKKTLFVVDVQPHELINAAYSAHKCEHIYFGANQSFPELDVNDAAGWLPWENMIKSCLLNDVLCTLDIDSKYVQGLLESGLCEYDNFIPMISIKLPYIQQLGYNAIIKLDDIDFKKSNPGVWCHSVHELQSRATFTDWSKYTKDEIIK